MTVRSKSRVKGVGRYIRRINRHVDEIEGVTMKGLIRAAIIIIRDTEQTPPLTPVDIGNLRASRFVVTSRGGTPMSNQTFKGKNRGKMTSHHSEVVNSAKSDAMATDKPTVILGFSASYAISVHENVGTGFQRPGAGAKFLQASVRRNEKEVVQMIKHEAKKR